MSFQSHQVCGYIVHVFVGVHGQQISMGLHRIVYLNHWYLTVAAEGADRFVGKPHGNEEVVDAHQSALHALARWQGNSDRHGASRILRRWAAPGTPTAGHPGIL
jgi:hypothetical protein